MKPKAEFGVFGGSGFYSFFKKGEEIYPETPYGFPSGKIRIARVRGRRVAFLPRHGAHHEFPPHMVPYRANLTAFAGLGVTRVLGPNAVGSLKAEVKPGDMVLCDQFVNFTTGRRDTFFDGPETTHVSVADPYCPELRRIAIGAASNLGISVHPTGTVVVIQGPRFSTRSESKFFRGQGWDVINMTQYPEVALARELEMCYLNISLVTDYDVGLEGDPGTKPVSHEEVVKVFNKNIASLRSLLAEIIKAVPLRRGCDCGKALEHARLSA
ncbi:MAG: S-methyl-5'-thioadenosine phosphorylase [Thaumarchaeota archaeon]|nr:S-methyl-5'-thioadenosine phosphorylase [Nitrososphaerota archaeon]